MTRATYAVEMLTRTHQAVAWTDALAPYMAPVDHIAQCLDALSFADAYVQPMSFEGEMYLSSRADASTDSTDQEGKVRHSVQGAPWHASDLSLYRRGRGE